MAKILHYKIFSMIIRIVSIALTTYILFGAFLYFNQRSMIYYPSDQDFQRCDGFSDYEKRGFKRTRFYYKQGAQNHVIVYYHGNGGSACDRSAIKSLFEQSHATVLFVEYAGYSNDDRKPSQNLILEDVRHIHEYISRGGYEHVTVYGQSIGAAAASYHASLGNVDQLLLVTPFSSLVDVAQSKFPLYPASLLLREKYDAVEWVQRYDGSLLILHGDRDRIIPNELSKKLFSASPSTEKDYVLIHDVGHNDIWSSPQFHSAVIEYVNEIRR